MSFRKLSLVFLFLISLLYLLYVTFKNPENSFYEENKKTNSNNTYFQPRLYKINNITVDFSLASEEFELEIIQYFDKILSNSNALSYYFNTNSTKKNPSPRITISPSTPTENIDLLVVNGNITSLFYLNVNRTSNYILFQETPEILNFSFDFVHLNPQWNHLFLPIILVENTLRINLLYLKSPILLLKRAPMDFRPIIDTLWELQHPSDCENAVCYFPLPILLI
jgi:hypothetical protein